jgi:aldose 1-epimerase
VQGIDFAFVVRANDADTMIPAAEVWEPASGRFLHVTTNQNCVVVYTADNLDANGATKDGAAYGPQHAICLETQNFPNGIHLPGRPDSVLRPGDRFYHRTDYAFSIRD